MTLSAFLPTKQNVPYVKPSNLWEEKTNDISSWGSTGVGAGGREGQGWLTEEGFLLSGLATGKVVGLK